MRSSVLIEICRSFRDCFGLARVHLLIGSKFSRHIFIGQRRKLGRSSPFHSPAVPSSYFRSITLCFICPEITLGSHVFSELLYDFCTGFVCEPHNNPADFFMDVIIECEASQRDGLVVSSGTESSPCLFFPNLFPRFPAVWSRFALVFDFIL